MKKVSIYLAALCLACFSTVALPSCTKDSQPETPADEQPKDDDGQKEEETKLTFEIAVDDILATGATVKITPSVDGKTFFFDVLNSDARAHFDEKGVQGYFDEVVAAYMSSYQLSKKDVLQKLLSTGVSEYSYTKFTALTDYRVVVFGADENGAVTTDASFLNFTTLPAASSDNKFTIKVSNISSNGADYEVTVTNPDDDYLVDIWPKSLVDELGDRGTMDYFLEYNGSILRWLTCNGDYSYENEGVWQPGRDYYVIAFGYADNEPTTSLCKQEFHTDGGDPAKCEFAFSYPDKAATSATVRVTPSDKKVVYIWNVTSVETFNKLKADKGSDEAAFVALLDDYISQTMVENECRKQHAVEAIGRWSGYTTEDPEGYDEEKIKGLASSTEYVVWAAAVDADGVPEGRFFSDTFTTLAE